MDDERLIVSVTLRVDVYLGCEPARGNPIMGYEPAYEYLVIRRAEVEDSTTYPPVGALNILGFEGWDNPDPDDLVIGEVHTHLLNMVESAPEL